MSDDNSLSRKLPWSDKTAGVVEKGKTTRDGFKPLAPEELVLPKAPIIPKAPERGEKKK